MPPRCKRWGGLPFNNAAKTYFGLMPRNFRTNGLELRVPPLAIVMIAGFLMWLAKVLAPAFTFRLAGQPWIAGLLAALGTAIACLGVLEFKQAKTTVNPTKPGTSSTLVTGGIYRHTRNPMYLGFLLTLTGWAIVMGNLPAFLILPAFVLYMNAFQIKPEERVLASIFGEEFERYRSRVRRWI